MTRKPRKPAPRRGQPPKMSGGRRVNAYLGTETLARAREIGEGNLSEGLRKAVLAFR